MCLSAGYLILCSGDRSICDRNTLIGSLGSSTRLYNISEPLQAMGLDAHCFTTDEHKLLTAIDPIAPSRDQTEVYDRISNAVTNTHAIIANYVLLVHADQSQEER